MNNIVTREHNEILIIQFQDVRLIDEITIQNIGSELVRLVTTTKLNKVLLNFENVKFMASAMLGKIALLRKKCIEKKVDLRVCCLTENIQEVFALMKLDTILDIYPSEAEAYADFEAKKKKWYV
ncbi:MAG TPA: STAS domain-containing protein [Pirellulaceae bacterium]|nr:STAS domain-containing protein [Pirellulaceae bacterium]HMO92933.1 STAS domain-containing protein [Pirellulaceae bacterium]HMP68502.1 STAS domain-containing protein [Pirellulaceae bacterium]